MDFIVNLEADRSEDNPEAEIPCGPTRPLDGNKMVLGLATGGQETEGGYDGGGYWIATSNRSDKVSVEHNTAVVPTVQGTPPPPTHHQVGAGTHINPEGGVYRQRPPQRMCQSRY